MSADKTTDAIKLNLRLPKSLHKRLVQQAKRNNVSLNTEIVNQLEGYDVATVKRMTEIVRPLLDQSVKASAEEAAFLAAKMFSRILQGASLEEMRGLIRQIEATPGSEPIVQAIQATVEADKPKK